MVKGGIFMLSILKNVFLKFQNQHPPLQELSDRSTLTAIKTEFCNLKYQESN